MGKSKKYYALSWEDMYDINIVTRQVVEEFDNNSITFDSIEELYKEILSRYLFRKHLLSNGWVNKGGVLVRYSNPRLGLKADGTLIIGYYEHPTKVHNLEQLSKAINEHD